MKKLYTSLVLIISIAYSLVAQTPSWSWAKSAGNLYEDIAKSAATDASGNVFVLGTFNGPSITFGSTTLTNATNGGQDCFLVKYNSAGVVQWAERFGGVGNELGNGICTDASGNVIVTGSFDSPTMVIGSTTLTDVNNVSVDFFLIKYDGAGNVIWAKSVGGSAAEAGRTLTTDATGNIYVTGTFSSTNLSFGSTLLTHQGSAYSDIFLVKYDANGNVLWAKAAGGTNVDEVWGITTDASSNVIITGDFQSTTLTVDTTHFANNHPGYYDIYILKYNTSGNLVWGRKAGGSDDDYAYAVCADAAGNSYLSGYCSSTTTSFGALTVSSFYGRSYLVKYDTAGNALFVDTVAGTPIKNFCKGNNVYVAGNFYGRAVFGNTTLVDSTHYDAFVTKYDLSGTPIWAISSMGGSNENLYGLSVTPNNDVVIAGEFYSPSINFGTTALSSPLSSYDVYVAQIGQTTTNIMESETTVNNILVYPNPFSEQTTIVLPSNYNPKQTTIKLMDVLGKEIKKVSVNSGNTITLDREDIKSGIYFLQITDGNNSFSKKMIVE